MNNEYQEKEYNPIIRQRISNKMDRYQKILFDSEQEFLDVMLKYEKVDLEKETFEFTRGRFG